LNNLTIQANQQNPQNQNTVESSHVDVFSENPAAFAEQSHYSHTPEPDLPLEGAPPWAMEGDFSSHDDRQSQANLNNENHPYFAEHQALDSQVDSQIGSQSIVEHPILENPAPQSQSVVPENNAQVDLSRVENNNAVADTHEAEFEYPANGDNLSNWIAIIKTLGLKGMAAEMANNSVLVELTDTQLAMSIDPAQQYAKPEMYLEQIAQAVKSKLGSDIELNCVSAESHYTPSKFYAQQESDKLAAAQKSIESDSVVQQLVSSLGMEVIPASIKPL